MSPLVAAGVLAATAATDAVYVTAAVAARRHIAAASWSSVWYLVLFRCEVHWIYVGFAALCSSLSTLRVDDLLEPRAEPSSASLGPMAD